MAAMAAGVAGVTDHVWSVREIAGLLDWPPVLEESSVLTDSMDAVQDRENHNGVIHKTGWLPR